MTELQVLARADGPRGETVLRRRGSGDDAVTELIVNGVFAMDSADPSSEQALGSLPLPPDARVLLGGLGLGYTASTLLDRDLARLDVVELEPALVDWARAAVTEPLGRVAADPRARLLVADVGELVSRPDVGPWDAILLDVDNGPDFLIHEANAALYSAGGLRAAYDRLDAGGLLAVWCQGPAPGLRAELSALAGPGLEPEEHRHRHRRGSREWSYVIYGLRRP